MKLEEYYKLKCNKPSDINEHLPTLKKYADECTSIVECGVRDIVSSYAFASSLKNKEKNTYVLIDPYKSCDINNFLKLCKSENVNAFFIESSDLTCPLITTDLLFIDTWHVYGQLKRELNYWHNSVKKYIIMHDTTVDEIYGESIRLRNDPNPKLRMDAEKQSKDYGIPIEEINKGLWPAIEEFLELHNEWKIKERFTNNNGLTILERYSL
jgi:hypothetical protein